MCIQLSYSFTAVRQASVVEGSEVDGVVGGVVDGAVGVVAGSVEGAVGY